MCRLAATLQTAEGKSPDYGGLRRVPELLQELVQELVPELLQELGQLQKHPSESVGLKLGFLRSSHDIWTFKV